MNVSLPNTGTRCILSSPVKSSTTVSPTVPIEAAPMTTGSLLQQLSHASLINSNLAAAAAATASLLPSVPGLGGSGSPMFTVEQLELIRRLRMTGISPDAVLEAFNTLEKIESDLDTNRMQSIALAALMGNTPTKIFPSDVTLPPMDMPTLHHQPQPQLLPQNVITTASPPSLLQQLSSQAFVNPSPAVSMPPLSSSSAVAQARVPSASLSAVTAANAIASEPKASPDLSSPERCTMATVPYASTAGPESLFGSFTASLGQQAPSSTSASSTPSTSSSSVTRPIRSQRTPMKEITTLDDPSELEEFMLQGEEGCINDMKQFITQFSLRQTTVAMMTGVSQPYISKLLNGNHKELSLRCRKNIYSWYLNCRRHPEKLAAFLQDPSTRLETNCDGELVPQRRERYVFRPILIKILEGFFAETPFPDYNKRAEIASACNSALQMDKKGVGLMPKEIVSPQVVANWFANKRKEMRRRSNEEALPPGTRLVQQNSENGDDLASTPSPLTPLDSASTLMEAENSGDIFGALPNPFKAAFLNSALQAKNDMMMMDSSNSVSPPTTSEPLANFDAIMHSGLFNNLIGAYQQQQLLHQQQTTQPSTTSPNNNHAFVVKMEQTAE